MEPIKVVLVDDDPEALDFLDNLLRDNVGNNNIIISAKDESADNALKSILKHRPEIVFLDIDMPGKDGFELVKELKEYDVSPVIIFVTAFDRFAIRAIRHSAFDFLLKPLEANELTECLSRYKEVKRKKDFNNRVDILLKEVTGKRLKFNTRTGFIYCHADDIVHIEADGSYCDLVCFDDERITISMNIGSLEEKLPGSIFFRINRSTIVNRQYIVKVDRKSKTIFLKAGEKEIEFHIPLKQIRKLEVQG